ncbi:ACT domain-containing protein [Tropicimonas isoalkanivorans]|nr:ACT domain-containing protein [Tropicimonas isoalkanivorans]
MVRRMAPRLVPGHFAFRTLNDAADLAEALPQAQGMFREREGISVILPADPGAPLAMRQITLDVPSALDGVGLTAAVAGALARSGIACNMVAAHHHDHVFVPEADADAAMDVLRALADGSEGKS